MSKKRKEFETFKDAFKAAAGLKHWPNAEVEKVRKEYSPASDLFGFVFIVKAESYIFLREDGSVE